MAGAISAEEKTDDEDFVRLNSPVPGATPSDVAGGAGGPVAGQGMRIEPEAVRGMGGSPGEAGLAEASRGLTEAREGMKETKARRDATMGPLYEDAEKTLQTQQANRPERPTFGKMPKAPQQTSGELIQNVQGYMGALMALQVLGSMGRKGPTGRSDGTTAMMAISGILQGAQQGAKEVVEENVKLWEASTKGILEQNRLKLQEYDTILKADQYEFNQKMQLMALKAKEFDDEFAYQKAMAQDSVALGKYMVALEKANDNLEFREQRIQMQREKLDLEKQKAGKAGEPKPSNFNQSQGVADMAERYIQNFAPGHANDPHLRGLVEQWVQQSVKSGGVPPAQESIRLSRII